MTITTDDIRREHQAAMGALTREQCKALDRLARARQLTHFRGRSPGHNLRRIFESEAEARTQALFEAQPRAA
jgi:hypothetical protein